MISRGSVLSLFLLVGLLGPAHGGVPVKRAPAIARPAAPVAARPGLARPAARPLGRVLAQPLPDKRPTPAQQLSDIGAALPDLAQPGKTGESAADETGAPFHGRAKLAGSGVAGADGTAASLEKGQAPAGPRESRCPFAKMFAAGTGAQPPGAIFRFPVKGLLRDMARASWEFITGKDAYRGYVRPERASFFRVLASAYANTQEVTKVLEQVHRRHGDFVEARAPWGQRFLFVSDPELGKEILKDTDRADKFGQSAFEKSEIQIGGLAQLTGRGTVFLGKKEDWKPRKELMQPYFLPKAVSSAAGHRKMDAVVETALQGLLRQAEARGPPGLTVSAMREMNALTMNVILNVLFGTTRTPERIAAEISPAFETVKKYFTWETANPTIFSLAHLPDGWRKKSRLKEAYETLERFADEIIAEGRSKGLGPADNLLGALLGSGMSQEQIRRELLTLILAGHETTASTLTWALKELSENPEALGRLRAEIAGLGGASPSHSQLQSMPILDSVVEETLRLHTPAFLIFRKAARDAVIVTRRGKVLIPAGSQIVVSSYVMHRREEQWGKAATGFEAGAFRPERFDGDARAAGDLATIPFGHGPRVCLGRALSVHESKLILVRFLQLFDYCPAMKGAGRRVIANLSTQPADGFPIRITALAR